MSLVGIWKGEAESDDAHFQRFDNLEEVPGETSGIQRTSGNDVAEGGCLGRDRGLLLQIFPPFLLAGMGMVAAGLFFGRVSRHWSVFVEVREILVLVPALLGLKGNLEMTLASRLSTQANLGLFDLQIQTLFRDGQFASIVYGNIVVVQCQAIVVGLFASIVAVSVNLVSTHVFNPSHALLLSTSAIASASAASGILSTLMVVMVVTARRCRLDPDNLASPIAGMFGDVCTMALLAIIAENLWSSREVCESVQYLLLGFFLLLGSVCAWWSYHNKHARPVLMEGWTPIILSMFISSVGGIILKHAVHSFHALASFAPVMNGAGGNLAAVHASRLSTKIHRCTCPSATADQMFSDEMECSGERNFGAESSWILICLAVPGSLCFCTIIVGVLSGWSCGPSILFSMLFALAALVQVFLLVVVAERLVVLLWRCGVDPDNSAIPYITSIGDVVGTLALTAAFWTLCELGGQTWNGNEAK